MAKIKKAQKGMTMRQLKKKYPSADTTARGDVRGTEMNAYAPKKVVQQYSDTYDAFQRKFGNKPAKDKKGGVVKKAQKGTLEYTYPSGKKVTMDTTGYSSGAKRFATKITQGKRPSGPSFGDSRYYDMNFNTNRKGATRMIEATQGKRETPSPTPIPLFGRKVKSQKTGGKVTSKAKKGATIKKSVKKK